MTEQPTSRNHFEKIHKSIQENKKFLNDDSESTYSGVRLNSINSGNLAALNNLTAVAIKPMIQPIPYSGLHKKLNQETIKEFNLNHEEQEQTQGTSLHKVDHIKQNMMIACNIDKLNEIKHYNQINVVSKLKKENHKMIKS